MSATGGWNEATFEEFVEASAWEVGNSLIGVRFPPTIAEVLVVEERSLTYPDYPAFAAVESSSLSPHLGPGSGGFAAGASGSSAEAASSYFDEYPANSYPYRPYHPFQVGQDGYCPSD